MSSLLEHVGIKQIWLDEDRDEEVIAIAMCEHWGWEDEQVFKQWLDQQAIFYSRNDDPMLGDINLGVLFHLNEDDEEYSRKITICKGLWEDKKIIEWMVQFAAENEE